jgi:plastocyanin
MRIRFRRSISCSLVALAACGGDSSDASDPLDPSFPTEPDKRTVDALPSIAFTPSVLEVVAGDTVTFAFGAVAHDVYFDSMAGAPGDIPGAVTNARVTRVFAVPGRYAYSCHIHPGMRGTVRVDSVPEPAPYVVGRAP